MNPLHWSSTGRLMASVVYRALVIGLAGTGLASPAHAQVVTGENVTFGAHYTRFQSGDRPFNCPDRSGFGVSIEARTAGRAFVGGAAQVHVAGAGECKGAVLLVPFEDGFAEESSGFDLLPAPSVAVSAGVLIPAGRPIAVAAAARLMWAGRGAAGRGLVPWLGGMVTIDELAGPLGVGIEYGSTRVPIELTREGRTVHTLGRWEPLWQVSLRLRPWR